MRHPVRNAAILGASIPLAWGILSFVLFNAPESTVTNIYWFMVYLTCPFWYLPGNAGTVLMPFLNAALYAVVAAGAIRLARLGASREHQKEN